MALDFTSSDIFLPGNIPFDPPGVDPSHIDNVVFNRDGSEPFHFDPNRLGTITPTLDEPEGFRINSSYLDDIFGINAEYFGNLPKRMIIPVLEGKYQVDSWYQTYGYLYVVEPEAWIPQISHRETLPASAFLTTHESEQETITEATFNVGASAEITIQAGGTFYGVTTEAKSTSEITVGYSKSTTTKEKLQTQGTSGKQPIYHLFVYPILKCRAIKRQRIDYTINDSSEELKWSPDSYNSGYWEERYVSDKRLSEVRKSTIHPVPMEGNGLGNKAYMLPVPQLTDSDELEVTTLMSRTGWKDWYVYDVPWELVDQNISIAAPHNAVAFKPISTWTTLPPMKP